MRALAVAALVLLATPALAQDHSRPDIIRGLCQKDGCDEFSVLKADRIRADEEGTLFQTRIRTYHSSSQGRVEKGEDTGYVFCSPTKPTILAQSQGKVADLNALEADLRSVVASGVKNSHANGAANGKANGHANGAAADH